MKRGKSKPGKGDVKGIRSSETRYPRKIKSKKKKKKKAKGKNESEIVNRQQNQQISDPIITTTTRVTP